MPLHGVDLDTILCEQEERTIGHDNVVSFDAVPLQIAKQPGRPTCAGLRQGMPAPLIAQTASGLITGADYTRLALPAC